MMTERRINAATACESVYRGLKNEIERGLYANGAQLPGEQELCRVFRAGRAEVRRALERLAADGLVRRERRRGYVCADAGKAVLPIDVAHLNDPIVPYLVGSADGQSLPR